MPYSQTEWDNRIEAAAKLGDEAKVEQLMMEQQDAFLAAYPGDVAPPMTPRRVKETGRQFGQKIGGKEAKLIAALLKGA